MLIEVGKLIYGGRRAGLAGLLWLRSESGRLSEDWLPELVTRNPV